MSWDATLTDDRGHIEIDVNYTHNCNRMIAAAILATEGAHIPLPTCAEPLARAIGPAWWKRLNGMTGEESKPFLAAIITELVDNRAKYEAMNPPVDWGSYATLVPTLVEMHDAIPDWPTVWETSG